MLTDPLVPGPPIVPGPCPDSGCPPTTEIDCILTQKVYDFCFASLTQNNVCFPIPTSCLPLPTGVTASGSITAVTCTVIGSTPILVNGVDTGFANVTVLVTATATITLTTPSGLVVCTFTGTLTFMQTFTLCAPTGTSITCEIPASALTPLAVVDTQVCGTVTVCLLVESMALVKLLVPAYGYCTPHLCMVSPAPPFACPPSPLFPPQCAPVGL